MEVAPAEQASEESIAAAQEEIDRITETLHNAEAMIADRDKTIAQQKGVIETLQKQVADLRAEVKELAGKPAPMTDADSGIPADNGTGDAPKDKNHRPIRSGMTYKEIREAQRRK